MKKSIRTNALNKYLNTLGIENENKEEITKYINGELGGEVSKTGLSALIKNYTDIEIPRIAEVLGLSENTVRSSNVQSAFRNYSNQRVAKWHNGANLYMKNMQDKEFVITTVGNLYVKSSKELHVENKYTGILSIFDEPIVLKKALDELGNKNYILTPSMLKSMVEKGYITLAGNEHIEQLNKMCHEIEEPVDYIKDVLLETMTEISINSVSKRQTSYKEASKSIKKLSNSVNKIKEEIDKIKELNLE